MKRNYRLTISYDGSRYQGWEHQPGTEMTIQGKLESCIARMLDVPLDEVELIGAGRTDAGVHAEGMTASIRMDTALSEQEIRDYLNRYLPDDICVRRVAAAGERFHARYSATGKTYRYTCYVGREKPVFDRKYVYTLEECPDVERMRRAAVFLAGEHDFASFCGRARMKKSTVRRVDSIEIAREGDRLTFTYRGSGFLQYMVRILTGTLLEVGFGEREPEEMPQLLAARERRLAGATAPAQGLTLVRVDYD